MEGETRFERRRSARKVPLASVGKRGYTVLLGVGIVNPFGPTLAVIATDGPLDAGARLPVLLMTLNPFAQACHVLGHLTIGERWDPVEDVVPFLDDIPLQGAPTLLLPSVRLSEEDAIALHARLLARFDDGARVLERVRSFPANPVDRVQAEVDLAFADLGKMLREGMDAADAPAARLDGEDAHELARALLDGHGASAELEAFFLAWSGSIACQPVLGPGAMSLADFAQVFSRLAESVDLPER